MISTITRSINERYHERAIYRVTVNPCVSQTQIMNCCQVYKKDCYKNENLDMALAVDQLQLVRSTVFLN